VWWSYVVQLAVQKCICACTKWISGEWSMQIRKDLACGIQVLNWSTPLFSVKWSWEVPVLRKLGMNCVMFIRKFVCFWSDSPQWARASLFTRFLDHTQRRTTVGRTPLDEWSARRRDLYLTSRNTHNRQTSMPPVGFERTVSAGKRPQTYAVDRAASGTSLYESY